MARNRRTFLLILATALAILAVLVGVEINQRAQEAQQADEDRRTREALPTRVPPTRTATPTPPTPLATRSPVPGTPAAPRETQTPIPAMTLTPTQTASPTIEGPEGMRLILDESFHDASLNPDVWNTKLQWGTTNPPELQEYVPEALSLQSGYLNITASRRQNGKTAYTSGVIASFDRFYFQYGYVEVRAKVPKGQGLWPAVWLLAQSHGSGEEIDIMEVLGNDPGTVHTTIHYKQLNGIKAVEGYETKGTDFSQDFHTYAVDWEWDKIVWTIDGKEVFRVTDHISHEPMYLIANLAVGGEWPGYPDQTTQFPASFLIDYIRVFTH